VVESIQLSTRGRRAKNIGCATRRPLPRAAGAAVAPASNVLLCAAISDLAVAPPFNPGRGAAVNPGPRRRGEAVRDRVRRGAPNAPPTRVVLRAAHV